MSNYERLIQRLGRKHLQPLTPVALYARVSSDRQDVDMSVSAQLRTLKGYARANGYIVVFKSHLRCKGTHVVSITEQAKSNVTGSHPPN